MNGSYILNVGGLKQSRITKKEKRVSPKLIKTTDAGNYI